MSRERNVPRTRGSTPPRPRDTSNPTPSEPGHVMLSGHTGVGRVVALPPSEVESGPVLCAGTTASLSVVVGQPVAVQPEWDADRHADAGLGAAGGVGGGDDE